jgi:hypothetical protein
VHEAQHNEAASGLSRPHLPFKKKTILVIHWDALRNAETIIVAHQLVLATFQDLLWNTTYLKIIQ